MITYDMSMASRRMTVYLTSSLMWDRSGGGGHSRGNGNGDGAHWLAIANMIESNSTSRETINAIHKTPSGSEYSSQWHTTYDMYD